MFGIGGSGGASAQANTLWGEEQAEGKNLWGQAGGIANTVVPYLQNEVIDPQGFGPTTLSQMLTQSGQSIGGSEGATKQTAMDLAARTGNTAAAPGIIASSGKAGIQSMSNNVNALNIANTMEKLKQQNQGAAGLSSLYGGDIQGSLMTNTQSNDAIKTRMQAEQNQQALLGRVLSGIASTAGDIAGGVGNMDFSGGSSFGENLGNFASGFGS